MRAKAKALVIPATPNTINVQAYKSVDSPIDDVFGALGREMDEANLPSNVCLYIRKLLTLANDHEMLKGASFDVPPDTNALCQRMANEVHRDVLPGDSHVTAMEPFKDEFGLWTSATTTPGLLKVTFVAMASQKIRVALYFTEASGLALRLGLWQEPAPQLKLEGCIALAAGPSSGEAHIMHRGYA